VLLQSILVCDAQSTPMRGNKPRNKGVLALQGIRAPVRGILLYGPPGTGKTMIAKAAAAAANCTFFAISASTLSSKWYGEGEQLVKELFESARAHAPSIIFVDEIDSILGARSSGEHDASRRLKTEFLVQLDGVATGAERVLVLAATNRPADLDDAIIRRLPTRILVPMPDAAARRLMVQGLLKGVHCRLSGGLLPRLLRRYTVQRQPHRLQS
jgi:SpoVK/Ycf46/Vps4 family AAA+-type ATPase